MSGNSVMGKENKDINPNKRSRMDTTVDKTGLSINLFIIPVGLYIVSGEWSVVSRVYLHFQHLTFNLQLYNIGLALSKLSIDIG